MKGILGFCCLPTECIREGSYVLQECSASQDNEMLFTERVEAQLLASLRARVREVDLKQRIPQHCAALAD